MGNKNNPFIRNGDLLLFGEKILAMKMKIIKKKNREELDAC